jgi:hypothetical protein
MQRVVPRRCGSFGSGWAERGITGNAGGNERMIAISPASGFTVLAGGCLSGLR